MKKPATQITTNTIVVSTPTIAHTTASFATPSFVAPTSAIKATTTRNNAPGSSLKSITTIVLPSPNKVEKRNPLPQQQWNVSIDEGEEVTSTKTQELENSLADVGKKRSRKGKTNDEKEEKELIQVQAAEKMGEEEEESEEDYQPTRKGKGKGTAKGKAKGKSKGKAK